MDMSEGFMCIPNMTAEYKVVNNQMVLIKKTCLKYNEKKQDFDPVPCEEE